MDTPNLSSPPKLSDHLFWDIDPSQLDFQRHKRLIVHRVLDYGLMKDWRLIKDYYGLKEIAAIAITIKDLSLKSASWVSVLSEMPLDKFSCCTTRPSKTNCWVS